MLSEFKPLEEIKEEITPEMIRKFYKELGEVSETIKEARKVLKDAISENEEIQGIDEEIKALKERRKEIISTNPILVEYKGHVDDAVSDRKDLIADAKSDGIPQGEISLAEKALKKDLDMKISTEIYANIADLVE